MGLSCYEASQSSWKDEWLTLLFSIPLVLSFCGEWGRAIVADGFTALAGMPQWYQIALGAIVSASFATRSAGKFFNMRGKMTAKFIEHKTVDAQKRKQKVKKKGKY